MRSSGAAASSRKTRIRFRTGSGAAFPLKTPVNPSLRVFVWFSQRLSGVDVHSFLVCLLVSVVPLLAQHDFYCNTVGNPTASFRTQRRRWKTEVCLRDSNVARRLLTFVVVLWQFGGCRLRATSLATLWWAGGGVGGSTRADSDDSTAAFATFAFGFSFRWRLLHLQSCSVRGSRGSVEGLVLPPSGWVDTGSTPNRNVVL